MKKKKKTFQGGEYYTREEFIALRKAIRFLARHDSDWATEKNCVGFSRSDTKLGHALARKEKWTIEDVHKAAELSYRYRKQLPKDIRDGLPKPKKTQKRTSRKSRNRKNYPLSLEKEDKDDKGGRYVG